MQSTIPIFTAAPTHHVTSYTHTNIFFKFFQNNFSQKFFGPFSTPLGAIAPYFRNPLLQLHIPIFSRRLHPIFLLMNLLMIITSTATPTPMKIKNEWCQDPVKWSLTTCLKPSLVLKWLNYLSQWQPRHSWQSNFTAKMCIKINSAFFVMNSLSRQSSIYGTSKLYVQIWVYSQNLK